MFNPTATRGPCTFRSGPLLAGAHTLGHQYVRNHWDTKGPGPQMRPDVGQRHSRWPDGCGYGAGDPRVLGEVSEAELNVGRLWHAESLVPYCWFTSFRLSWLPPTCFRLWSLWACFTSLAHFRLWACRGTVPLGMLVCQTSSASSVCMGLASMC